MVCLLSIALSTIYTIAVTYLSRSYHFFYSQVADTFTLLIALITPDFQQAKENYLSFTHSVHTESVVLMDGMHKRKSL